MEIEKKIEDFILNASYGEVLNYKKSGKTPIVESYESNQWSYIIEIMILTIKSLKPSVKENGNTIDQNRFRNELILWTQYRHGLNKNLIYSIENKLSDDYFTEIDESVYARLSVIVCANQNWETIKSEVIKTVLYSSANPEIILESIMLSRVLFIKLSTKNCDYDEILSDIKDEAINFSQIELDNYSIYFKVPKTEYNKGYKIQFERTRINLISILNGIKLCSDFVLLKESLDLLNRSKQTSSEDTSLEKKSKFFLEGLDGLLKGEVKSSQIKDIKFLKSLCAYLVKLRKGRIALESLDVGVVNLLDLFDYCEGESFTHPLLNSSKVIYKGERGEFTVSYIQTRTGIYRFVKTNKD